MESQRYMTSCIRSTAPLYRVERIPVDYTRGSEIFHDAAERTRGDPLIDDSTYHLRITGGPPPPGHYVRLRCTPPPYDSMYIADKLVRGDNTLAILRQRRRPQQMR